MKEKLKNPIMWVIVSIVAAWLGSFWLILHLTGCIVTAGQVGDTFGAINALFSGVALIGIVYALTIQRSEDKIEKDRETRLSTFYELMNFRHNSLTNLVARDLTGKAVLDYYYKHLKATVTNPNIDLDKHRFYELLRVHGSEFEHHLKLLTVIFAHVVYANHFQKQEIAKLVLIFDSQLSPEEKGLWAYVSYFQREQAPEIFSKLKEYNIFKSLKADELGHKIITTTLSIRNLTKKYSLEIFHRILKSVVDKELMKTADDRDHAIDGLTVFFRNLAIAV
jgi:hypothetical protein